MLYETIDLYEYFSLPRGKNEGGKLTVYAHEHKVKICDKVRPAMLVVPGGGYSFVSERENEPIAIAFFGAGYVAFSLEYTVNTPYPVPLIEGAMAMAFIRLEAEKYGVNPAQVGVIGFSAGGHLAGMLATMFDDEAVCAALKKNAALVRPDAAILSYAVLTTDEKTTHGGTARMISGGDKALREKLSLEKRVTDKSSPAFLWHTVTDGAVPVENALLMALAYRQAGVPFELHIYEEGVHGLSLATLETCDSTDSPSYNESAQSWVQLALTWLKHRGFAILTKPAQ